MRQTYIVAEEEPRHSMRELTRAMEAFGAATAVVGKAMRENAAVMERFRVDMRRAQRRARYNAKMSARAKGR